jgi:GNAT superfamily N-acetyltransferase
MPISLVNLRLAVSPTPVELLQEYAITILLAFSNGNWRRWCCTTPSGIVTNTADDIPARRLSRETREYGRLELDPRTVIVGAIHDRKVVGVAIWCMPKELARPESVAKVIYRKFLEYLDMVEDILFPSWWMNGDRYSQVERATGTFRKEHGLILEEVWQLSLICVRPDYHRQGIGSRLMEWGLDQAKASGRKVYIEASPLGKGLCMKKGFKAVGEVVLQDGNDRFENTIMIWNGVGMPVGNEPSES